MEFMQSLNELFPFICFDSPFAFVQDELNHINNLPSSVIKGSYNKSSLQRFLKESSLMNLHDLIDREQLQDLLYDVDLRRKVDGMSIAGFRYREIELEIKQVIPDIDPVIVKTYLDCFANYNNMTFDEKRNFIIQTFEDAYERKVLLKCLESKSQDKIRMYLNVNARAFNPIEMINKTAQIVTLKTQEGLIEEDEDKIRTYLKLSIKVAEAIRDFGVGNKDATEALLAALTKNPEDLGIVSPKPMSVDELEDAFLQNQKPPNS